MKKITGMLIAALLSLLSFYSTCWYSISGYLEILIPLVFAAIFSYVLLIFLVYRKVSHT